MGFRQVITAARLINKAADAFEHRHDDIAAEELIIRALGMLRDEKSDLARTHTGRARQLQAEILLSRGEVDGCLEAYAAAEKIFAANPRSRELYVRFIHDAVLTLAGVGMDDVARHYVAKGLVAAAGLSGPYEEDLKRIELEIEDCTAENYESYKRRIKAYIKTTSSPKNRGLIHRLAEVGIQFGTASDIKESLTTVEVLYEMSNSVEQQIIALQPLAYCAMRPVGPLPASLLDATREVLQLVGELPATLQSEAYLIRAVALWSAGTAREALDASLRAVALSDSEAWRIGASVVRLMTSRDASNARYVALRLACELDEAGLAAELIETARLPAVPDVSAAASTSVVMNTQMKPDRVLRRPLRPLHPLMVQGRSHLRVHYPASLPLAAPLTLEESIRRIGGADAWWWAGWLGPEGYRFWATRSPEGTFACGYSGDSLESPESKLLKRALAATPAISTNAPEVISGDFTRNYFSEEITSAQLGSMLIPEPLKAVLATVARKENLPIDLIIAGNYLSLLPLPLLSPVEFGTGQPARLIELAVIRTAPPVAMVAEIATSELTSLPYPVAIVCADPTSELIHARLPPNALHLLGGRAIREDNPQALPATRSNLIQALRSLPSTAAVFAYSGHAGEGSAGGDLESYLLLEDKERLVADSLFARSNGRPAIPFPQRALLAACGSAGSAGSGRGEWLGIGAGVLASGAQEVVATAWPILDLPFTRQLDESVLTVLTNELDVARGLREVQLECLSDWRSFTGDHSSGGLQDLTVPLPLIWASYQFLGIKRP